RRLKCWTYRWPRSRISFAGPDTSQGVIKEMHVIRHQAEGVQGAFGLRQEIAQRRQIDEPVGVVAEARLTVVPSLNNMQCHVGDHQARESRHGRDNVRRVGAVDSSGSVPEL